MVHLQKFVKVTGDMPDSHTALINTNANTRLYNLPRDEKLPPNFTMHRAELKAATLTFNTDKLIDYASSLSSIHTKL